MLNEIQARSTLTSDPIGSWEVKLEIMTDKSTDRAADGHEGS